MEDSDMLHELLLLILIRLPVKSLLRFRCVSKSWNLLISTQGFAKMHLEQSLIQPKPLGLIWFQERMKQEYIVRIHIFAVDCSKLEDSAHTIHRLHHPFEVPSYVASKLIGSCNGLLCVVSTSVNGSIYDESFSVFNPWIRNGSTFYRETPWCRTVRSDYYGFGYDDVHNDYKVVTWGVHSRRSDDPNCSKFDVYSMKEGSWRTKDSGLTGYYKNGISRGGLVNCVLHWIWKNSEGRYKIVAFDLRTEEHMLMDTPENVLAILESDDDDEKNDLDIPELDDDDDDDEDYCFMMKLGALNGCLCVFVSHYKVLNKLDLWVMKEYGLKDSWTKMTIDILFDEQFARGLHTKLGQVRSIVPIVHVENKKQMILYGYEDEFIVCDMVPNKLSKVIKIPEFDPTGHDIRRRRSSLIPKEFCFQESLVKPSGFDNFHSLWDE